MWKYKELVSSFRYGPTLHMTLSKVAEFPETKKKKREKKCIPSVTSNDLSMWEGRQIVLTFPALAAQKPQS